MAVAEKLTFLVLPLATCFILPIVNNWWQTTD